MFRDDSINIDSINITIGKEIGYGVTAKVYEGTYEYKVENNNDKTLKLAIKNLCADSAQNEIDIFNEISRHNNDPYFDNIVQYYGSSEKLPIGFSSGVVIMMELATFSLHDYMLMKPFLSGAPVGWSTTYPIIQDIAKGINFLHGIDIIHCDIKRKNILVLESKNEKNEIVIKAKLCDFDLSKFSSPQKYQGDNKPVGSLLYRAPELMGENSVANTKESDMYSFALVLLEIATKNDAYKNFPSTVIFEKYIREGNKAEIPADCEPKVAHLITWGWDQKPSERITSSEMVKETETDINTISPTLRTHERK